MCLRWSVFCLSMYAKACKKILVSCCTVGGTRIKNQLKSCHGVFEGISCHHQSLYCTVWKSGCDIVIWKLFYRFSCSFHMYTLEWNGVDNKYTFSLT
jgi:hypothetical protein